MEVSMNPLTRYEPLVGRLDGLFDEFLRPALVWENNAAPQIRVDVKETAEAYTVAAEIPGVSKDKIAVEIEGNEVTISAETARAPAKEGEKFLRVERFYGKTARRFALPQDLDEGRAEARFADGVLELTLPKKAAVTGRKLDIR
jgi:HSP20 family protein